MNTNTGTIWSSHTEYVDIETGEKLTKKDALNIDKFIIIKTKSNATFNSNKTRGHITYTRECRKQPQRKLFN